MNNVDTNLESLVGTHTVIHYSDTTVESLSGTHTVKQYGDSTVENLIAHTL